MLIDTHSQIMFTNNDLLELLYQGHLETIVHALVDPDIDHFESLEELGFKKYAPMSDTLPTEESQPSWFIPPEYQNFDIETYVKSICYTKQEIDRVDYEFDIYKRHGLLPLLQTLKYIVDTLRQHSIIWGIGRGSSVASYVLFLIGVHKIDSIKFNIPFNEFIKEI